MRTSPFLKHKHPTERVRDYVAITVEELQTEQHRLTSAAEAGVTVEDYHEDQTRREEETWFRREWRRYKERRRKKPQKKLIIAPTDKTVRFSTEIHSIQQIRGIWKSVRNRFSLLLVLSCHWGRLLVSYTRDSRFKYNKHFIILVLYYVYHWIQRHQWKPWGKA